MVPIDRQTANFAPFDVSRRGFLEGLAGAGSLALLAGAEVVSPRVMYAANLKNTVPQPHFPFPDRIRYDRHCFWIENQPTFIFSGSFHYFRGARPLWAHRFARIRAAGFNAVQTYIAWNLHEPDMPRNLHDFSGVDISALDEWLTLAAKHDLHVIIRPGPYICAEYNTGGFPRWLLAKRPAHFPGIWLRSADPEFVNWSLHWYRAVCPLLARHQITRKAPGQKGIILFQLENEYNYSGQSAAAGRTYISALARCARDHGIAVPLFTNDSNCVIGAGNRELRGVVDGQDWYPGSNVTGISRDIDALRGSQPAAPVFSPEMQGGWFDATIWPPSLRTNSDNYAGLGPQQVNNLTLYAMARGVSMINYYMLFGGTNFANMAARGIATSYDYSAAIRECGGVGSKYQALAAIGNMLDDHGAAIAQSVPVAFTGDTGDPAVEALARLAPSGDVYIFLRMNRHHHGRSGKATLHLTAPVRRTIAFDYQLDTFGSKILYIRRSTDANAAPQWLPGPAEPLARPMAAQVPKAVNISLLRFRADSGPIHFKPATPDKAMELSSLWDNNMVYYRSEFRLPAGTDTPDFLIVFYSGAGRIIAMLNSEPALPATAQQPGRMTFQTKGIIHRGVNKVLLLYENQGNLNNGRDLGELSGITRIFLAPNLPGQQLLKSWRMKHISPPPAGQPGSPILKPHTADTHRQWSQISLKPGGSADQLQPNQWAIFQHSVTFTTNQLTDTELKLSFSHIDNDGWIYVNNKLIGTSNDWSHPYEFGLTHHIYPGENIISVVVQNVAGGGGIADPRISWSGGGPGTLDGRLSLTAQTVGITGGWSNPDTADATWKQEAMPVRHSMHTIGGGLMDWYRLAFELPEPETGIWVPWCLRIYAQGNGYIFLNGNNLGRYWNEYDGHPGGQHEFYLPECWLNFGHGKGNVIALQLVPVKGVTGLTSAAVVPYSFYALKI